MVRWSKIPHFPAGGKPGKNDFPAGIAGSIIGILPGNQADNKIPTRTSGKNFLAGIPGLFVGILPGKQGAVKIPREIRENFPDRNSGIIYRGLTGKVGRN